MDFPSQPGVTYAITSAVGCTVSVYNSAHELVQIKDVPANKQVCVTAHGMLLVVSDDSALLTKVFNWAPAAGGDGGELSPEAKAFLEYVTDGKLSFGPDGRLKIATSVDATGTFNHDGYASNYTKVVDGVKYTTTVNANEVKVIRRENGTDTVLMHLHEGVLELGGSPVPTMSLTEANAALSILSWNALCKTAGSDWWNDKMRACVSGDTAFVDLSAIEPALNAATSFNAPNSPLLSSEGGSVKLGGGVSGLKRMTLKVGNVFRNGYSHTLPLNAEVDFTIVSKSYNYWNFIQTQGQAGWPMAKSLTIVSASAGNPASHWAPGYVGTSEYAITTRIEADFLPFHVEFILPNYAGAIPSYTVRTLQNRDWFYDDPTKLTRLDITAAMPSYVSSFDFYKANFNSVDNLVYLMDNLGTPASGSTPQLTFGIDAALVDTSGVEPVYSDASLQAAVERFRAKGWEDVPNPLIEPTN